MVRVPAERVPEAYDAGYAKAIGDVVFHLRYIDWQEETAADAVEAMFAASGHPEADSSNGTEA